MPRIYTRVSLAERLAQKSVARASGCIEFTGYIRRSGYGEIGSGGRERSLLAHRAAWICARGPIPDGLFVCHRCDNRLCVNVEHLFLGTAIDNVRDMCAKGRQSRHMMKLTASAIAKVKRLRRQGMSAEAVGRLFNVAASTIRRRAPDVNRTYSRRRAA
jgi:hypothetical protein